MKSYILTLGIFCAICAQAAQTEPRVTATAGALMIQATAYRGMPVLDNSKLPWLHRNASAQPSQAATPSTDPNALAHKLDTMLSSLNEELANTEAGLTILNSRIESTMFPETAPVEPAFPPIPAADYSALASRDLSSSEGQDLSVLCSQNLSTSLAVPTSLPWVPWANKQGNVAVATPTGTMVGPAFPPRTAWGNGPGVVATTAGGAVYAMIPESQHAMDAANTVAIRDVQRQIDTLRGDIQSIRPLLENLSTNRMATPPSFQQPYLVPTGRTR